MGWLLSGRWSKTPLQVAPYPASLPSHSHCTPPAWGPPETKRKARVRTLLGTPWGCRAPPQTGAVLWALGEGVQKTEKDGLGVGWGRELVSLLHHHFAQFKPCDFFPPSPHCPSGYQHLPSPRAQEHRLRCQVLSIKGVCLYSKRAVAHSESAHLKATHVTAPPAPSPSRTDANCWLETFLNMSLAQRVRFPGLLCPGRPSQDFRGCREGEGWGQAGSGGSQLRQPSALEISPAPLPGLPALLREEKGLPCIQKV